MDSIFGLFGIGCGLYCLYGYYLLKFKGEISTVDPSSQGCRSQEMQGFPGILQGSPVAASQSWAVSPLSMERWISTTYM